MVLVLVMVSGNGNGEWNSAADRINYRRRHHLAMIPSMTLARPPRPIRRHLHAFIYCFFLPPYGAFERRFSSSSTMMERVTRFLKRQQPAEAEYEPIHNDSLDADHVSVDERLSKVPFSWIEYIIFLLLGVSMLWAW